MGTIDAGLKDLVHVIGEHGIRSIALPPLGCGLGGLDWGMCAPALKRRSPAASMALMALTWLF